MIRRISVFALGFTLSISSAFSAPVTQPVTSPKETPDHSVYTPSTGVRNAWVGALLGAAVPTLDGLSGRFAYGGGGGFRFHPNFGLGASFTTSSEDVGPGSVRIGLLAVEGIFYFPEAPGFSLGIRGGPAFESASVSVGSATFSGSDTEFFAGAQTGYDFLVADQFSLGLEVDWNHVFGSPKSYEVFNFLVPLRVWF